VEPAPRVRRRRAPHAAHPDRSAASVLVAQGRAVLSADPRAPAPARLVARAHEECTRALDINPNKQHDFATGGDDGLVKLWDARHTAAPLITLGAHTHW